VADSFLIAIIMMNLHQIANVFKLINLTVEKLENGGNDLIAFDRFVVRFGSSELTFAF